ncbi:phosrestin-2-like [Folsomia candida]|uniref:phosrestin-2-like n=1 Tax=Folsomia candida TaxID=158441 RepID=UPI001604B067|nr:phosrestin-2-like [Folsomia candida]
MSFPAAGQSSEKLISDLATNASASYETSPNLNINHATRLPVDEIFSKEASATSSQQPTQYDVINSHPLDDAKNVPPGSSITRVYKKCASNGSLAVYVGTRTLTVEGLQLEPLKGVLVLDKDSLAENVSQNFRIWGVICLTFRYGREDEEVLGLRFCNEAILALKQLWPPVSASENPENHSVQDEDDELTPLQVVLLERISASSTSASITSIGFTLCAGPVGLGSFPPPPSVLLAPAKPYKGSPIGTIYDLRVYASERPEERPPRRNLIRLALRAVQIPSMSLELELHGSVESRPTFLSRGKIRLSCELDRNAVRYGEPLVVKINVQNNSRSSIRRIIVSLIQQVDVCMFTSGKFKNVVGLVEDAILLVPGASCQKRYTLTAARGPARQWLALEEAFGRDPILAPSTSLESMDVQAAAELSSKNTPNSRNVFAIIVSYYVKAKLVLGGLSLCQNVKVPFVLLPPQIPDDPDPYPTPKGEIVPVVSAATTETISPLNTDSSQRRATREVGEESHQLAAGSQQPQKSTDEAASSSIAS